MQKAIENVFIVAAKRLPFGKLGGKLSGISANDLAVHACRAVLRAASVAPEEVQHCVIGNMIQSSSDAVLISRHAALKSGLPVTSTALTLNILCGSGFQALINATQQIQLGCANLVLAGGAENMSQVPFVVRNARFGIPVGTDLVLEDFLGKNNIDTLVGMNMPQTAELLAEKYGIKRDESDEFALESQKRWKKAKESGIFDAEIEPISVKMGKKEEVFDTDENPRVTSLEKLGQLKTYVKKDGIGMGDGAGAVLLASESSVSRLGLRPLARVVGYQVAGCDPRIMGIAPVHAIRGLCERTSVPLDKVDLIETNEAFAAQVLAVQKELGLEKGRLNQNGGAIAVGHPFAASGSRIISHLTHELRRKNARYAIGSTCIGGGQGIAVMLEKV